MGINDIDLQSDSTTLILSRKEYTAAGHKPLLTSAKVWTTPCMILLRN